MFYTLIMTLILGEAAHAAINRGVQVLARPSQIFDSGVLMSPELIQAYNEVKAKEKPVDYTPFIPTGLASGQNEMDLARAFADRGLTYFWNSEPFRQSQFGQTAAKVEKSMAQEGAIHTEKMEHKFRFQIQAFQGQAKLDYEGYANTSIYYSAQRAAGGVSVQEKLTERQSLGLNHEILPDDRLTRLTWNLKW